MSYSVLPYWYTIDIAGMCNLRCPYCLEGVKYNQQPHAFMTVDEFKHISCSFIQNAGTIELYSWSEPFLNKDVFKIIKYINDSSGAKVYISTNGNLFSREMAEQLARLRIYRFVITISGIRNDIYQKYHRAGDINKVFDTIKLITEARLEANNGMRQLCIKYLVFDYNYITLLKLKKHFLRMLGKEKFNKIDKFEMIDGYLSGCTIEPSKSINIYESDASLFTRKSSFKDKCNFQFTACAIRADGTVFPCCVVPYRKEYEMGNLYQNTMEEIWHTPKFIKWRESFLKGRNETCNSCYIRAVGFRHYKPIHLASKLVRKLYCAILKLNNN